ncbi:MAG: malate dehydrogenase [Chloroflexi bacterium]|nr:malate dehydrogenase [Chloroflexota bacterium]|tara:strand:- start:438 stop:1367 length:930 start_codon:yes stop_codon:yes gene_type:complete
MKSKVTVVGAGNVGATTAQRIFEKGHSDVVLIDVVEGIPQGKALDILESGPIVKSDAKIIGTNSYEESKDSDIVVITAGIARKPGMSRDDLLITNMNIVGSVTESVISKSKNPIIIVVSNPLDAMVQHCYQKSGLSKERVIGMAGILDTGRFRTFLSEELNVSVNSIDAYVLGGHGDSMVPLLKATTIGGVPVEEMIEKSRLEEIVQRTRDGGAEIVAHLKTGSAYYAPSAAVAQMVDAIIHDTKEVFPCAAMLDGEYGIKGVYAGVPVKLGSSGIEEIINLNLSQSEKDGLLTSSKAVEELIEVMKGQ